MSWQTYVDSNLVGSGHVTVAAIIGLDGRIWAKSGALSISADEIKVLLGGIKDPTTISKKSVLVNGQKYVVINADNKSIYGKKPTGGLVVCKTLTAILLAVFEGSIQGGACMNVVEKLAEYLSSNAL